VTAARETTWDIVFHALAEEHRTGNLGGGMIGKTAAVCAALGLDPDLHLRDALVAAVSAATMVDKGGKQ
jgi:hypothetical protein